MRLLEPLAVRRSWKRAYSGVDWAHSNLPVGPETVKGRPMNAGIIAVIEGGSELCIK